ncbi:MAG: hypothetical protein ACRD3K_11365, partial [Edaphobacter sp.]
SPENISQKVGVFFDHEKVVAKPHELVRFHHTSTTNSPAKKHHKIAKPPVKTTFHHAEKISACKFKKSCG